MGLMQPLQFVSGGDEQKVVESLGASKARKTGSVKAARLRSLLVKMFR